MAMTLSQGHHTLASNCPASEDEWKTELRIWMVGVGWSHCLLGKNVGCVQVVDYLQEEANVNGNALTYLLIHERAVLFCWGPLSMWSHFCHCEQRKGMASFWYSQALHTRMDTLGPRIPRKYPDKTSPWQHYDPAKPPIDGPPWCQSSRAASRSQVSSQTPRNWSNQIWPAKRNLVLGHSENHK